MDLNNIDPKFNSVLERTRVVRPPRQALETFGVTNVRYHLVTEPVYRDLDPAPDHETVVRYGMVRAERPQVVTPHFLLQADSFSDGARQFLEELSKIQGPDSPGVLYSYKNEPGGMDIVSGKLMDVANRIARELDENNRALEAVIVGVDELWDVSLMKFIYELTHSSARTNVSQLRSAGMLEMDQGIPNDARRRIERMIEAAGQGRLDPAQVMNEMKRWDLVDEYEDRFFGLFRR